MPKPPANEKSAGLPVDDPSRRRLPPLLRQAWYRLNQAFRRRIAHTGLTPDQFTVLRNLTEGNERGMRQSELVEIMCSDPNTISSLVQRMLESGLIERAPHENDRRANQIRITPEGRKAFRQVRAIAVELQLEILAAVPKDEVETFLLHLEAVGNACRKAAEASGKG